MGSNEIIKLYALVILFDQSIFNVHIYPYVPKLIMRIVEDNCNTPHAGSLLASYAYHLMWFTRHTRAGNRQAVSITGS